MASTPEKYEQEIDLALSVIDGVVFYVPRVIGCLISLNDNQQSYSVLHLSFDDSEREYIDGFLETVSDKDIKKYAFIKKVGDAVFLVIFIIFDQIISEKELEDAAKLRSEIPKNGKVTVVVNINIPIPDEIIEMCDINQVKKENAYLPVGILSSRFFSNRILGIGIDTMDGDYALLLVEIFGVEQ